MHLLFAAMSGWGKSYHAQAVLEQNLLNYDTVIILDLKDEYTGLPEAGLTSYRIVGERELPGDPTDWRDALADVGHIVLSRVEDMPVDQWRELCNNIIAGARRLPGSTLIAIDEAHFVAPQSGKLPPAIKGLATTGRGEGASSMWITQRLTEIDSTITAQCTSRMLGGFSDDNDLRKIAKPTDYPEQANKAGGVNVPGLPSALHAPDAGPISVRRFEENDSTVGSEWLFSNDRGDMQRINTRNVTMESTHHGAEGHRINLPEYA